MGTVKVTTDFSYKNYSDLELNVKSSNVVGNMTGNIYFPNPMPPLIEITETITSYDAALIKAENGTAEDRVIKNSWRAKLEGQMKDLSMYVQIASKGDDVIVSSSGLDVNRKPGAIGPLQKPVNVSVKMGNNMGSVWVSCDAIPSASFYEYDYAEVTADGTLNWIHKTSTKHKILIEGLTSGKQYVFRVAGAASDPSRVWSDRISSFVI
jgi:hypothetical protein